MSRIRLTKKLAIDGAGWLDRGAEIDLGERFNDGLVNVGRAAYVEEPKPKRVKVQHIESKEPEPIEPTPQAEVTQEA